jgi:hypothetical protein
MGAALIGCVYGAARVERRVRRVLPDSVIASVAFRQRKSLIALSRIGILKERVKRRVARCRAFPRGTRYFAWDSVSFFRSPR